jgi:hypothetical protein
VLIGSYILHCRNDVNRVFVCGDNEDKAAAYADKGA